MLCSLAHFIGLIATNGFMQNYLGYDTQTGTGRVSAVAPREQPKVESKERYIVDKPGLP